MLAVHTIPTSTSFSLAMAPINAASGQAGQDVPGCHQHHRQAPGWHVSRSQTALTPRQRLNLALVPKQLRTLSTLLIRTQAHLLTWLTWLSRADTQYSITFRTLGAQTVLSGSTVSLFPESTPTASIAVDGDGTTYAQQIIEIARQPAIYQQTWSTITNGFNGTLALNTTRLLQSLVLEAGQPFYLEVKLNGETVAREVVGMEHSTMPASCIQRRSNHQFTRRIRSRPNVKRQLQRSSMGGRDCSRWHSHVCEW